MHANLSRYREIWVVDFEFAAIDGENPRPVCLVARELRQNRLVRMWRDEMESMPPYDVSADTLFVAYYASAEIGCHLELGWRVPERILDLFPEFCIETNHSPKRQKGRKLVDALTYCGLNAMEATAKEAMQKWIASGGPFSFADRLKILNYCQTDVDTTSDLLLQMIPYLDVPRGLLRGRYMAACARMERCGIPISHRRFETLRDHEEDIERLLINEVNDRFGVYDDELSFRKQLFLDFLAREGLAWPVLKDGSPDLKEATFKTMSTVYPHILPLWELRRSESKIRFSKIAVGSDGFNRCILSPFASKTGRNQPSTSKFLLGGAAFVRHLAQAPPGYSLVNVDFEQQEFGVGAYLSGDPNMMAAYETRDAYLAFACQAKAAPEGATKATHGLVRTRYKIGSLATQYDIHAPTLAAQLGAPLYVAAFLINHHKRLYRRFWEYAHDRIDHAKLNGYIETCLGWRMHVDYLTKSRTILNWPIQATAAEMLRIAACEATEAGLLLAAPVHDAFWLLTPTERWKEDTEHLRDIMRGASATVLDGHEIRTEATPFHYPDHYVDEDRGVPMWQILDALLKDQPWARELYSKA